MSPLSISPLIVLLFLLSSAISFFYVQGCATNELKALLEFKSTLNISEGRFMSWKGDNCCRWDGVECLERQVSKLDLRGSRLTSFSREIPSALFELEHLSYLDLSNIGFQGEIPSQLGGLSSLNHLDLSGNEFSGEIPSQLGGLSSLNHLDLSFSLSLTSHNFLWFSNLSSLEYLSLRYVNVSDKSWGSIIGSLLHLKHLDLSGCSLVSSTIPNTLLNLSSLGFLNLSSNSFSNIPTWMAKLTSLTYLNLAANNISGSIPNAIGNLTNLEYLSLSQNALTGPIPPHIGNLFALEKLYLNDNKLQGNIPASLGNIHKLTDLGLFNNHLSGSLPLSFSLLSSLAYLDVSGNNLDGVIPSALVLPSSMVELHLSYNNLNGTITEVFFQKSLKLKYLYLSHSGLSINVSSTWIPPFQVEKLLVRKCQIGGPIPMWISTQLSLAQLDLEGTQLVGNIPSWLWDMDIKALRLSDNHLQGSFTPTAGPLMYLDLEMNELSGHLPADIHKRLSKARVLVLANNKFEGQIPISIANLNNLILLDLSNNALTGNIPAALGNLTYLQGLHLQNNYLEGEIPKELASFSDLRSLRIGNNSLQGVLPSPLRNLSSLQVLDVGENNLTGNIPHWIANFSSLSVLVLRSNNYRGLLPPHIGGMPKLQVLDLSSNFFSGTIPHSYLRFPAMQNSSADGGYLVVFTDSHDINIDENPMRHTPDLSGSVDLIVKGQERHYEYVHLNLALIDLSNNRLSGPLPLEIDNLKGLIYLNLSMNNLSGPIPESLGNLVQLESLDLSFNQFSGKIPYQIGNLTYLEHLNLSYNNMSGMIPLQGPQMLTFDESSYIGNQNLWGCPLQRNCSRRVAMASPPPVGVKGKREEGFEFPWYWMCFGLLVAVGFSAVVAVLVLNVNWKVKCFEMMDRVIEEMDRVMRWRE